MGKDPIESNTDQSKSARGQRKLWPNNVTVYSTWFSYFLYQDNLMWGRLKTIITVQFGAVGGAYLFRQHAGFAIFIVLICFVLSLLTVCLMIRDEGIRDYIQYKVLPTYYPYGNEPIPEKKTFLALRGRSFVHCLLLVLLLIVNVVFISFLARDPFQPEAEASSPGRSRAVVTPSESQPPVPGNGWLPARPTGDAEASKP